ncbi:MAG TPA: acylphosphatase [bacterium]|jgi:acylphosphatase|nr:acylphosphatase [bacterium]
MDDGPVRCHLWISGSVQGVGFRLFAERAARRHGVAGFVRNLPDGRVEAVAEGSSEGVRGFVAELARGPRGALVRDVREVWEPPEGLRGFRIG